jgi:hypothetical protein
MKATDHVLLAVLATATIFAGFAQAQENRQANPAVAGTGQANHIAIWTSNTNLSSSVIYQSGSEVGIGTTTPAATLEVNGNTQVDGNLNFSGSILENGATLIWAPSQANNLAVGLNNLSSATSGVENTGVGADALEGDTSGSYNTAVGFAALNSVGAGQGNTAIGYAALLYNTGLENTAVGMNALVSNTTGGQNIGVGNVALGGNTSGTGNIGIGSGTLNTNITGNFNTAVGFGAGENSNLSENSAGSNNTFLGYSAIPATQSQVSNATAIGANAQVGQSNTLVLGGSGSNAVTVGIGTPTPYTDYALVIQTPSSGIINGGVVSNASGGNLYLGMTNSVHKFRVDTNGVVYADGGVQSSGADFAESVTVRGLRSRYEPGDVLEIDPKADRNLRLSQHPYATVVAGIYSTKPGVLATPHHLDDSSVGTNEVPMAVMGIVPCKVSAENGPIARGDLLVTSSRPGYAMKGTDRPRMLGAVVGKALEPLPKGRGVIQVLVTLQ